MAMLCTGRAWLGAVDGVVLAVDPYAVARGPQRPDHLYRFGQRRDRFGGGAPWPALAAMASQ